MKNRIKQSLRSPLIILSFIIGLLYLGIFIRFVLLFGSNGLSANPNDWYDFIGMATGIIGLAITGLIAWQIQNINSKSTSKYAKLPYAIKSYEKFVELKLAYIEQRDKVVEYNSTLFGITNNYLSELAKFNYFECVYFNNAIRENLNEYRISLLKYLSWLATQEKVKAVDFVCDHSIHTQELYDIFDGIQKMMQDYIGD